MFEKSENPAVSASLETEPGAAPLSGKRPTLQQRFVTRVSPELARAIVVASRREGLSASAWVRRLILERTPLHSDVDAHSGRPVRLPKEEVTAIAVAVRELASVNAAISLSDGRAARAGLDRARDLLIPVLMRHARR